MKTLLITLEYPPFNGGVANYYENLVQYWPEPENISVWTNERHELINEKWPILKWVPAILLLIKKIKTQKIEHVIVGQLLPLGSVAYYASKLFKFKYSVIIHGMDFTLAISRSRKKKLTEKILSRAQSVVCTNGYVANLVREFIGKEQLTKVTVVNPGVSPTQLLGVDSSKVDELKERYGLNGKYVLLSLGRLVKRKGVDQVILALEQLMDRLPGLVYVVAGTGPDEAYLKNYAASVSNYFSDHVKFLGAITNEEKWQWLTLCDCMIMPAREEAGDFEGFGIVYLEAGLAGKPVIAGDSGGVPDAVEHMINGYLVDPLDSSAIANAVAELMDNPAVAERLGSDGRDRAAKEFAWPDKIKIIYDKINS